MPTMVWQESWEGTNGTTLPSSPNTWTETFQDSGIFAGMYRFLDIGAEVLTSARCEEDLGSTDQYAETTILSLVDTGGVSVTGITLRNDDVDDTYYAFLAGCNDAAGQGSGSFQIQYHLDTVQTIIYGVAAYTYADGDVLRFEIVGSTLTCLINDVEVYEVTNTVIAGGTKAGVAGYILFAGDHAEQYSTEAGVMGDLFNPANLTVTPTGSTAALTWDASAGAIDYSIFRRTPTTGVPFVPGVDTPIASGVTTLFYNDNSLSPATYEYQVFGRLT